MAFTQIRSDAQRSLLANRQLTSAANTRALRSGSTSQLTSPSGNGPSTSPNLPAGASYTASTRRGLAGSNSVESRPSSRRPPTTTNERDHARQALTTLRDARNVEILRGVFVNATNYYQGVPRPDTEGNTAVGSTGVESTQDYSSQIGAPGPSEQSDYEIYCKYLLAKKRGTPLWEPGPQLFPTEYRRNGVSIGDVGILDPTTGDFAFLFNIFLPANHEINEGRVPNGFIPLDKSKATNYMKTSILHDRCLASSTLRRADSSDFAFQTTGREGALLVTPDGGISEELHNHTLVEKYVAANAKIWWESCVESDDCGLQTDNGLQVIIGTDKVSSWGMAAFQNVGSDQPMEFELTDSGMASQTRTYKWRRINGKAWPAEEETQDLLPGPNMTPLRNQCVFVRTLNVSVSSKVRDEMAVHEVCSSCLESCQHQAQPGQRYVTIQSSKAGRTVSHPLQLLNQYLLEQCPNAEVVITKDSDLMSVMTEDDAMPGVVEMCVRVLDSHIICEEKGVITLKNREEVVSAGSMLFPSTISMPSLQQATSEEVLPIGDEKGSYLIGRLFLGTADEQSIIGPSDNDDIGRDDSGMDVDCTEILGEPSSAAFSSVAKRIVSGSYDQPVRVRNAKMGEQLTALGVVSQKMKDPGEKEPLQKTFAKTPAQRGKYMNACNMCRRKKIRCNGVRPFCEQCLTSGRARECTWNKSSVDRPRTEQHFQAIHKRGGNVHKVLDDYRRYADYLESILDPKITVDFRALRPSIPDVLITNEPRDEFKMDIEQDRESESDDEIRVFNGWTVNEEGRIIHHGDTSPFRFQAERLSLPSQSPAILEDPQVYNLIIDPESEAHYNPDFEWSRHLPSAVPLDRRSHDRALDLFFKFFTSWCFRIVPDLFLRDMCRALNVPPSQDPPGTPHYSPMLHNALVALALAFHDDPRLRDFKTRQLFVEKAKSFLDAECQNPNISVIQALSLIGSFHSSQGDHTLGYMYFGMSTRVSQALGVNVDCTAWVKAGHMDEFDRHDRNWTNWTTFAQDVCWSLYVGRDFSVPIPDVPITLVDIAHDQIPSTYGVLNAEPQPNLLTMTFEATCRLLVISRRIMDVVNSLPSKKARQHDIDKLISEIDVQLNNWKASLAAELEITIKSRPTATPHKLMLYIAFWWLFILLHRPFCRRKRRDGEIDHVKLCRRAAENIMENLATWRALYSLRYCPITLIQTVFAAGTVYLLTGTQAIRISSKEIDHATKELASIMDYLQEISATWQCATNIADILKGLMQDRRLVLDRKAMGVHHFLQLPTPDDDDEPASQGHRDRIQRRKETRGWSRNSSSGDSSVTLVDPGSTEPTKHHMSILSALIE